MAPTTRRKISIAVPGMKKEGSENVSEEDDVVDISNSRTSAKSRRSQSEHVQKEEENDIDDMGEGEDDEEEDDEDEDEDQEGVDAADPEHSRKPAKTRGKYKKRSPSVNRGYTSRSGGPNGSFLTQLDPESTMRECIRVMDVLTSAKAPDGHYYAAEFMELPSKKDFPDYYESVKRPICLSHMQRKLQSGSYKTVKEFKDDVARCVFNAKKYNLPRSPIYMDALQIASMCRRAIRGKPPVRQHSSRTISHGPDQPIEPVAATAAERRIQMNAELGIRFSSILALQDEGRTRCDIFMQLPDQKEYPSYYTAISKPVCFSQILKKIKKSEVVNVQEASEFVQLIFSNAKLFNEEESEVYLDAVFLQERFDRSFSSFPTDLRDPDVEPAPVPIVTNHPPRIIVKLNSTTSNSPGHMPLSGGFPSFPESHPSSQHQQLPFSNGINTQFQSYPPHLYGGHRAPIQNTYVQSAPMQPYNMSSPVSIQSSANQQGPIFGASLNTNGSNISPFQTQNFVNINRVVPQPNFSVPINKPSQFDFPPSLQSITIEVVPNGTHQTLFINPWVRNHSLGLGSDSTSIKILPVLISALAHSEESYNKNGQLSLYNGSSLVLRRGEVGEKMEIDETKTPPPEVNADSITSDAQDIAEWELPILKGETRLEVRWQPNDTTKLRELYKIFIVKL